MLTDKEFRERFSSKGYTKKDTATIIKDFLTTMESMFAEGKSIQFINFGKFVVKDFDERRCLSPKDKQEIIVPAYRSVKFKISDEMRRRLQSNGERGDNNAETE